MTQPTAEEIKDIAQALSNLLGKPIKATEEMLRIAADAPHLTPEQMEERALLAKLNAKYRGARFVRLPVNRRVKR